MARRNQSQANAITGRKTEDDDQETPLISFDPLVRLPQDILFAVLKKIESKDMASLRLVSVPWKNALTFSLPALLYPRQDPLLVHHHGLLNIPISMREERSFLNIFNPERKAWEKRWLPWSWSAYRLVGTDGGLLFFLKHDDNHQLAVYNVVTAAFRELSVPSELRYVHERFIKDSKYQLTGIFVSKETGNYKLLLASFIAGNTLIYDSRTCLWKTSSSVPLCSRADITSLRLVGENKNVILDGCLYWGFLALRGWRFIKMVLRFDMKKEVWSRAELPAPALWHFQIALCRDKVMTMNLQHDLDWPRPCPTWIRDTRIKDIGPEFRGPSMTEKMLESIRREQMKYGCSDCVEYYGLGHGEKFFHVMRGSLPGIRIAIQNTRTLENPSFCFWKDGSHGNFKAKCSEFMIITPSFRAQP